MNKKAKQILQKADIEKLPTLPHVLLQLLEVCHGKSRSFKELAAILKHDPGLYLRVFAECARNRADCEPFESPDFFEKSLQSQGIKTVQSIAANAAVQQYFSQADHGRTGFLKQHWYHSVFCAMLAEAIASEYKYRNPVEAYIAGLLHNIGQLVLETIYPDKYRNILEQLSEDSDLDTLEKNDFGTTRHQLGALLLTDIGVNHFICDAVLYHHETVDSILDVHPLVKIIHLASRLAMYNSAVGQDIYDAAEQLLGFDSNQVSRVLDKVKQRIAGISGKFEIGLIDTEMDSAAEQQQNAIDELKQAELADQIKNIALLDSLYQHMPRSSGNGEDSKAQINIIMQNIAILFGVNESIIFLYDSSSDRINAISADNQPSQISDISIPLISGRSMVVDALITQEVLHSFHTGSGEPDSGKKLSIIDQQLIGILQKDGVLCLPMIINDVAIGALVLGVNELQYRSLSKQLSFLTRFANEVGQIIHSNYISGKPARSSGKYRNQLEQRIHEVLHEVRNPLSIMNNYLGILSYKLENDKPAQEDIKTIKSEIERINQILGRLTEEETATDTTTLVDINAIITDLTRVFQTSLFASKNIQISLDLDDRIQALPSNANAIKQIYTNLIKNAVEALDANGEIMVYTQDYVNVDGEDNIEISVGDNGPGIDVDILQRLFSPIETTKGGSHAGLGLTIVKNLVNELQGSISCRSSDKGTGFYILLPKQPKKMIKSQPSRDNADN